MQIGDNLGNKWPGFVIVANAMMGNLPIVYQGLTWVRGSEEAT